MEPYLGVPLLALLTGVVLLVSRFQRRPWVAALVGAFAAAACVAAAYRLWQNPGVAILLAVLAVLLALQLAFEWAVDRARRWAKRRR